MDKIHDKANKLFGDIRKKKNMLSRNIKDPTKKNPQYNSNLSYKCCIYCQKVFIDSKFLMKHLLRRHTDELVLFYRNLSSHECNNIGDLKHLIVILHKEFSSLKDELVSAKLVEGNHEADSGDVKQTTVEETFHTTRINQNSNSDIVSDEITDLKKRMLCIEKDIQNLNDKFEELDIVLKNEILMKQNISEKLVLSREEIMEAQESQFILLKQILLSELKSLLFNQQQENSSEWKSQLLELRHEIERLDYVINNIKLPLTCTNSLKEEIKKELMPSFIPYIHEKKCSKKTPKTSLHKTELSLSKSYQTLKQKELSEYENFSCKGSNSKNVRGESKITLEAYDDLPSLVADKLSLFSIEPNTSKISSSQYNKTLKLLCMEKERLSKKYGSFYEIYNDINMRADRKAYNELKGKKHHRIKFSEPLTSSRNSLNHSITSFNDSIHEQSALVQNVNKQLACVKKFMPTEFNRVSEKDSPPTLQHKNFAFPDKAAYGDSVHPYSNSKQNKSNKHAEVFKNSTFIEEIQGAKDLNTTLSKGPSIVIAKQSKHKMQLNCISPIEQRKLNSAVNNHSIQFTETPIFKTSDKLNELEGKCKTEDDFDDVSSLETYKSSDDDHTVDCS